MTKQCKCEHWQDCTVCMPHRFDVDGRTGECVCGEPTALNTIHRTDGPCYVAEPVDFTSLLSEADEIVRGKPVWKRFIDGTPLSNDIAVWMTVFAQGVVRRSALPQRKPIDDKTLWEMWVESPSDVLRFARAIEQAHGIQPDPAAEAMRDLLRTGVGVIAPQDKETA